MTMGVEDYNEGRENQVDILLMSMTPLGLSMQI